MMKNDQINVLIADDSALIRSIYEDVIPMSHNQLKVVGSAKNGKEAVELNRLLKPDIITMDIEMPVMGGLDAIKHIMADRPVPIIVISNAVDANISFKAIEFGAVEVMKKPDISDFNDPVFFSCFQEKLIMLSKVGQRLKSHHSFSEEIPQTSKKTKKGINLVVIGASTGGPKAVLEVLKAIPADFPAGIAMVQHIEDEFDKSYIEWLDSQIALNARLAQNNETVCAGDILMAPGNRHIELHSNRIILNDGPKVLNQKPSVDTLFKSAAQAFGEHLVGILLTGMGRDGAEGCCEILKCNGHTLVQDEATSDIFGMPKAAIELGGASEVLPLKQIANSLMKNVSQHS